MAVAGVDAGVRAFVTDPTGAPAVGVNVFGFLDAANKDLLWLVVTDPKRRYAGLFHSVLLSALPREPSSQSDVTSINGEYGRVQQRAAAVVVTVIGVTLAAWKGWEVYDTMVDVMDFGIHHGQLSWDAYHLCATPHEFSVFASNLGNEVADLILFNKISGVADKPYKAARILFGNTKKGGTISRRSIEDAVREAAGEKGVGEVFENAWVDQSRRLKIGFFPQADGTLVVELNAATPNDFQCPPPVACTVNTDCGAGFVCYKRACAVQQYASADAGADAGDSGPATDAGSPDASGDADDASTNPVHSDAGAAGDAGATKAPTPPANRALSWGEPHLVTFDGLKYDMQAVGELVLVADASDGLEMQMRTTNATNWSSNNVSFAVAFAARVASDRVSLYSDGTVLVNGSSLHVREGAHALPGGGALYVSGVQYRLVWPDNTQMLVNWLPTRMSVDVWLPNARAGQIEGLLGNLDGSLLGELKIRGGAALEASPTFKRFYDPFVESWRVTQETSLFDYGPGEDTETYTNRAFPKGPANLDTLSADARAAATQVCEAAQVSPDWLHACVLDVAITGEEGFAGLFVGAPSPAATLEPVFRTGAVSCGEESNCLANSGKLGTWHCSAPATPNAVASSFDLLVEANGKLTHFNSSYQGQMFAGCMSCAGDHEMRGTNVSAVYVRGSFDVNADMAALEWQWCAGSNLDACFANGGNPASATCTRAQ